ncbi:MAG: hypothetical protein N0E48_26035 [Candidatus Thiodiazotropha endolucinida]|nr:hypothetical protein [Candidatus Thiodiazotropha endolucinida]
MALYLLTLPLRETFMEWIRSNIGNNLYNELSACDAEQYLIKVLGAVYCACTSVPDELWNTLVTCGILYIKECVDFLRESQGRDKLNDPPSTS